MSKIPTKVLLLTQELVDGAYIEEDRRNVCPVVTVVRSNGERVKNAWAESKSWLSRGGFLDYIVTPRGFNWTLSDAGQVWAKFQIQEQEKENVHST